MPDSAGKRESVEQDKRGSHSGPEGIAMYITACWVWWTGCSGCCGKTPKSRLKWLALLTQTDFQSPRSTSPRGQRACPGTGRECRVAPCAGSWRVRHYGRSGALDLGGTHWTCLGPPISFLFEMKTSLAPLASRLTRRVVTSWLLKARSWSERKGEQGTVICRFLLLGWGFNSLPSAGIYYNTLL